MTKWNFVIKAVLWRFFTDPWQKITVIDRHIFVVKVDLPAARWKVTDAAPKTSKRASQRGEPREPTCHLIVARPKLEERQTTRLYHLLRRSDLGDGHSKQAAYKYSVLAAPCALRRAPRFKLKKRPVTIYQLPHAPPATPTILRRCARLRPPPCPRREWLICTTFFFETWTYMIFLSMTFMACRTYAYNLCKFF
jgi:hypothetical protein